MQKYIFKLLILALSLGVIDAHAEFDVERARKEAHSAKARVEFFADNPECGTKDRPNIDYEKYIESTFDLVNRWRPLKEKIRAETCGNEAVDCFKKYQSEIRELLALDANNLTSYTMALSAGAQVAIQQKKILRKLSQERTRAKTTLDLFELKIYVAIKVKDVQGEDCLFRKSKKSFTKELFSQIKSDHSEIEKRKGRLTSDELTRYQELEASAAQLLARD